MLVPGPKRPDSDLKNIKKWGDACVTKTIMADKLSKWGPKIYAKSIKNPSWNPKSSFSFSRVAMDRSRVSQGAKMEVPGMPNSFGHQK